MIEVFAPASCGNFAVGFDLLGAAIAPINGKLLGDVVAIDKSDKQQDEFHCIGPYANKLSNNKEDNLAYQCLLHFRQFVARDMPTCTLLLHKNLPVGSGLGSSACSVVATFTALDKFAQTALSQYQLLELMADFEQKVSGGRHFDNIAPSYIGGLQLCGDLLPNKSLAIPTDENWHLVVAYPGFALNTAESRAVLPKQVELKKTIAYGQRLSGFITLCFSQQFEQAMSVMKDEIAQPHREELISGFVEAKQTLLSTGAKIVTISGAGPTLLALTDSLEKAQEVNQWLKSNYINEQGFCHICKIDTQGTRILKKGESNDLA